MAANKIQPRHHPTAGRTRRSRAAADHDGTVSELLVTLANKLTSGASTAYRDAFGVGTVEGRILALVAAERWITPQQICRLGGLDKGGVSRSMRLLHDRGLLVVRRSGADARSVELALTPKGGALNERIRRLAHERERRLMAGLTRPEVRDLLETLRRLNARVAAVNDPTKRS